MKQTTQNYFRINILQTKKNDYYVQRLFNIKFQLGKVKDLPLSAVGKLIGEKVEENLKAGFFTNASAIACRMLLTIQNSML